MNNEEFINKKVQKVIDIYENIENKLLLKIVEHFKYKEEFLNSDYWRIKKLDEMGLFNREVINYIAKETKKTPEQIKKALKDIGYNSFNIETLNKAFKENKLKIEPNILIQNNTLNTIINGVYNEVNERFINLSSKIAEATRNAYLDIVEETYLKTTTGTHSYQEAIRESINNLSNSGIKTLIYKTVDKDNNVTGIRSYDIEATARREILTGARQVNLKLNETIINELEPEYLYLSEHLRCRPTHFDWQGIIIKKEDLVPVTDYGELTGLGGINCAHYFEPYFGSARGADLKIISKEDALKNYNISQQQRYLERGVRKWKRKAEMYKENGDTEAYEKSQIKVKEWQQRNIEFSKDNKLKRDFTREYVSGFKSENVKIKLSDNNINKLKEVNIIPDNSLIKIDSKLLNKNINQINKLAKKYNMEEFLETMNTTYMCNKKKSVASVGYNQDITQMYINSSIDYFKDKSNYDNMMKDSKEIGWCMPCKKDKEDIYIMTHEMGHVLEMKIFKDEYPFGGSNEYKLFCNKVKDDIMSIAEKNKEFDYLATISEYGDKKTSDFFAEVFASMEVGYSNDLSKAMKKYLEDRGML